VYTTHWKTKPEGKHNLGDTGVQMNLAVVCTRVQIYFWASILIKILWKNCLLACYNDVCEVGIICLSILGSILGMWSASLSGHIVLVDRACGPPWIFCHRGPTACQNCLGEQKTSFSCLWLPIHRWFTILTELTQFPIRSIWKK